MRTDTKYSIVILLTLLATLATVFIILKVAYYAMASSSSLDAPLALLSVALWWCAVRLFESISESYSVYIRNEYERQKKKEKNDT